MSAIWPTAVATDADLYVAKNSLQTTLATALGTSDVSVVLASATGWPVAGAAVVDNEVIFYTGISGATLTGCTRGADGTTAATHSVGVPVGAAIVAFHHNGLMAEIEAIETYLSANLGTGATPLTASRALVTNASNKIIASSVLATEIAFVAGVTSAIQTQIDGKLSLSGGTMSGDVAMGSHKLTGLAAGSSNGDSLRYEQVIGQFLLLSGGTLTGALTINPATNQLVLGGVSAGRTVTITAPQPATSSRTWTIPDVVSDATFAALEGTQTFSGNKTFSGTVNIANTKLQIGGNQGYPIVQIVTGSTTTQATSTSGTYADSGLSAAITPKFSTSKILVIISQNIGASAASTLATFRLQRDSTALAPYSGDPIGWYSVGGEGYTTMSVSLYDAPGDTSAHTYKTTFARSSGAGTVKVQTNQSSTVVTGSYITLIEVAQ